MLDMVLSLLQRLLEFKGDYYHAFASTRPQCPCDVCQKPPTLSDKAGVIEVATIVARLLCDGVKSGESHPPVNYGWAPDQSWLSRS